MTLLKYLKIIHFSRILFFMKNTLKKIAFEQINRALDLMIIFIVCEPLYEHCFIKLNLLIKTFKEMIHEKNLKK